jgi:hypothetical protein
MTARNYRFVLAVCIISGLVLSVFCTDLIHATARSGNVSLSLTADEPVGAAPRQGIVSHQFSYSLALGNGTSAGQIDRAYSAEFSTAASGSETIDVRSFTDADGTTGLAMAEVVCVVVDNSRGSTTLHVGNATNPLLFFSTSSSYLAPVEAGAVLLKCLNSGYTTGSGARNLKVLNTSGSTAASFRVFVLGRSA